MNLHVFLQDFYIHVSTYFLQVNLIIYFILVCVVMVQVSYIPWCRVMFDLHNLGAFGPRLCKSRITLHLGM